MIAKSGQSICDVG